MTLIITILLVISYENFDGQYNEYIHNFSRVVKPCLCFICVHLLNYFHVLFSSLLFSMNASSHGNYIEKMADSDAIQFESRILIGFS